MFKNIAQNDGIEKGKQVILILFAKIFHCSMKEIINSSPVPRLCRIGFNAIYIYPVVPQCRTEITVAASCLKYLCRFYEMLPAVLLKKEKSLSVRVVFDIKIYFSIIIFIHIRDLFEGRYFYEEEENLREKGSFFKLPFPQAAGGKKTKLKPKPKPDRLYILREKCVSEMIFGLNGCNFPSQRF